MEFTKWHGLGNDFVFVEMSPNEISPEKAAASARKICDRNFGVGGDGLVFVFRDDQGVFNMRIFNADGTEPEMCGNAIRCVAKYVYTRGMVQETTFPVQTKAGIKVPEIILNNGEVTAVKVDMGEPVLDRELIPVAGQPGSRVIDEELLIDGEPLQITAVSMGNPHCILFVPGADSAPVGTMGPQLESHRHFPAKTNVEFVEVVNRGEVRARVWERGVGETLACGTGSCAIAVGGILTGRLEKEVKVNLPGGSLIVEWNPNNHVYMTGPAEEVFRGRLNPTFLTGD